MALVVEIDGTPVYSNKQLAYVIGTRAYFADGSWYDASDGSVHSVGPGYINTDGDIDDDAEDISEVSKRFAAKKLHVSRVAANLQVSVHDSDDIEYVITGPASQIDAVLATVVGDTLYIERDHSGPLSNGASFVSNGGSGSTTTIQHVHGRTVIFGDGNFVGNGSFMSNSFGQGNVTTVLAGNTGNAVRITVKVPKGASVDADRVFGKVDIGDIDGPLTARVQGDSVYAGRVTSAELLIEHSGDIRVAEVNGVVTAKVQGSGSINIERGSMLALVAAVQASGGINVGGSATRATLKVQGSGNIHVAHVKNHPTRVVQGSGSISVQRVG